MFSLMPWFLPVGISIGCIGTHTAVVEKRLRGGRWHIDSMLLAALGWVPLMLWVLSCWFGPFE